MKLVVDITREDYADFFKFHFMKTGFKKSIVFYFFLLMICLIIINLREFGWTQTIIFTFVYAILVYFILIRWINKSKIIPLDGGSFLTETEYDFTDHKIFYKNENSEGSIDWSMIKTFEESKTAYYLYIDRIVAYVIPKRFFLNEQEKLTFQELVKRQIQK